MGLSRLLQAVIVGGTLALVPNPAQAAIFAPFTHGRSGSTAGLRELGAVAHSMPVHAAVALAPRDAAGLAAYAEGVATPGSPLYHHYLSVSEFAARFAPAAAQVAAVRASLVRHGLAPGTISANGLTLPVSASAGTVETAFSTSLQRFALRNGQTGFANTSQPALDPSVAGLVQGVVGLNTRAPSAPRITVAHAKQPVAHRQAVSQATSAGAAQGCSAARTEAASQAGYTTGQIAARYHLNDLYAAGIHGSGVTVAVYELEPFSSADVAAFRSCFHARSSVSTVSVDGGAGSGPGSGEAAMDIEDVIGLAPQANVRVYEGPPTGDGAYDTYARIVSDNVAKVVTTSWGLCEADQSPGTAAAEATLFQEAAAQGQTILASTGDLGSDDCSSHRRSVDDPASQPWVTAVGASSIQASADAVWNNSYGASGGGVSAVWARPAYQATAAQAENSVSCGAGGTTCREVPDVTVNGDPNTGYVVFYDGQWNTMGGTSISTPTWAALAALADSSPACAGHPVGFADPALYKLAATAYAANFGDVTSGANGHDHVAGFSAGPGYDMASGLGTPNARSIVPALCGGPTIPTATTTAARARAMTTKPRGGGITVARPGARSSRLGKRVQVRLRARDAHGLAMRYAATGLPRGLKIDARTGVIAGRASHAGSHRVTVRISDAHGGLARAGFRWRVLAPRPRV